VIKKLKISVCILFSVFLLVSCVPSVRFASRSNSVSQNNSTSTETSKVVMGETFRGLASYYADEFNGRKTSNGEIFDMNDFTAAHRTLPFGTKLQVTNLKNGKSVIVRINDRGPFAEDRIIDLSKAAAEAIGMLNDGVAEVEIRVIE
jgi:rare lipoprotein A